MVLRGPEPRIDERTAHGIHRTVDERLRDLLELVAGEGGAEVAAFGPAGDEERQEDLVALGIAECDLRLLGSLDETLHRKVVQTDVPARLLLEFGKEMVLDRIVDVVAPELVVATGGHDLDDALVDVEDGAVERAATEVEDEDLLLHALRRARRRWAR